MVCPVNASGPYAPLTCLSGSTCCRGNHWGPYQCREDAGCDVCAECCHDELKNNQTACNACVAASCKPGSFGDWGCQNPSQGSGSRCCTRGMPQPAATAVPNCLLVGDSVTNGMFPYVQKALDGVCQVQHIESTDAYNEGVCFWSTETSGVDGQPIPWKVIHYNEGLHSLWPRVNTSAEMATWAGQLANFTTLLQATDATLIYATMTPFMPEKYLNPPGPPQNDVETKNALAVQTVKTQGVQRINDLYTVVTNFCGKVYRNCSICDDESAYHPQGQCGYHYVTQGWELLANATVAAIKQALAA